MHWCTPTDMLTYICLHTLTPPTLCDTFTCALTHLLTQLITYLTPSHTCPHTHTLECPRPCPLKVCPQVSQTLSESLWVEVMS